VSSLSQLDDMPPKKLAPIAHYPVRPYSAFDSTLVKRYRFTEVRALVRPPFAAPPVYPLFATNRPSKIPYLSKRYPVPCEDLQDEVNRLFLCSFVGARDPCTRGLPPSLPFLSLSPSSLIHQPSNLPPFPILSYSQQSNPPVLQFYQGPKLCSLPLANRLAPSDPREPLTSF
jgi:hypothetical protein